MDFASAGFIGFLMAVALLYAVVPRHWRCPLIIAVSCWFYWSWSRWFFLLLLGTALLAFYAARERKAALMATSLLFAILILFKSLPLAGISLIPLGISYYTFKLAGYLIDVYWEAVEPERRLLPFVAYTFFFPQIVGGPIQRAQTFLPQIERAPAVPPGTIARGAVRIMLGFFKKFIVADNVAQIVNYVYAHLGADPGAPAAFAFYGYPLQMYADFSGLTDIAIGAGVMLGIDSPENFNAPFLAASPSEYWRRWHMTLTLWMTDYVFTPLRMGLRGLGNIGLVLSLFLNMILIGLWHGFYWTFALFGVVHAVYLSADALTQKARKRWYKMHPRMDRFTDWLGPLVTFHLIAVAFVLFRADSLSTASALFQHLFDGWSGFSPAFDAVIDRSSRSLSLLALGVVLMECADALRRRFWGRPLPVALPRWGRWSAYGGTALTVIFVVALLMTTSAETSPFLYAIF